MKRQSILVVPISLFLVTPLASANMTTFSDDFDDGNADGWWLDPRGN
ncbi:MAG: hypothetical protein ACYS9Y_06700 [Planctomycetota bacterium]